jgi:RNA polymerase sigma-70 factor (ECF subfamily)
MWRVDQTVLNRAQAGSGDAFAELVEPHRRELHVHCYRLLGSVTDAEDVLQETLLAAWRGLSGFEERSSLRTWLYRIATNRCLNAIRDGRRRLPEPEPPFTPPEPTHFGDVTWLQPYPDATLEAIADQAPGPESRYTSKEAVELAFVTGLQTLPPRQAATLVLCDVLGFPRADVADMLGASETVVKGALQRARASLKSRRANDRARQAEPGSPIERDFTQRFVAAFTAGDVDAVVELLTEDAWLAMPPAPHEYYGRSAIRRFLYASFGWRAERAVTAIATSANGQPAFACYYAEPGDNVGRPAGLVVLTVGDDGITSVTRFLDPAVLGHFGLPDTVRPTSPR